MAPKKSACSMIARVNEPDRASSAGKRIPRNSTSSATGAAITARPITTARTASPLPGAVSNVKTSCGASPKPIRPQISKERTDTASTGATIAAPSATPLATDRRP